MKRFIGSVGAAVLLLLFATLQAARSQDGVIEGQPIASVPANVLADYVAMLKQGEWYKAAKALNEPAVEAEVAKLRESSNLSIELYKRDYRDECFSDYTPNRLQASASKGQTTTVYSVERSELDDGSRVWLLLLAQQSPAGTTSSSYLLKPTDLPELSFEYVESITVIHPLCEPNCDCRARDISFTSFAADFCERYGVEYAVSATDDEMLSVNLQKRSFVECMQMAASVSRRSVQFSPHPQNRRVSLDTGISNELGLAPFEAVMTEVQSITEYISRQRVTVVLPMKAATQR